ncbi:MAG: cell division ATPase MinD [Methanobacterium paludis]|uniref:Cell division ATPase MinD n=1 Tax=Methanobacterium paludis (strain DSM 25820 / JCM 18151 / SWAN1) TaxID=868131 RepID=F6D3C0_METPW|nr:cell division ATPase MinD [Methanobacterium paludis]AEG18712.1 cell division ATPase MinD [Methanobacterium paludis]MCE7699385.1 cell division ATPase MinD [Methanobacterium paludis]
MSRFIAFVSGKGGVGRTSLTFNLGVAMSFFGEEIVMLDFDLVMANMDVITGLLNPEATLNDVLVRDKPIQECVYEVGQGVNVVPTGIHFETLKHINPNYISWNKIMNEIAEYGDIFLMDLPAGINSNIFEGLPQDTELIIVTNSTMPSVADSLKIRIFFKELNIKIVGFVLNMWYDDKFLLSPNEIESILEVPMVGLVPYDREMERSMALGKSVVEVNPSAPISNAIMQLAADLLGKPYNPIEPDKKGILKRLKKFVGLLE